VDGHPASVPVPLQLLKAEGVLLKYGPAMMGILVLCCQVVLCQGQGESNIAFINVVCELGISRDRAPAVGMQC
jgi:hypothetical protein